MVNVGNGILNLFAWKCYRLEPWSIQMVTVLYPKHPASYKNEIVSSAQHPNHSANELQSL